MINKPSDHFPRSADPQLAVSWIKRDPGVDVEALDFTSMPAPSVSYGRELRTAAFPRSKPVHRPADGRLLTPWMQQLIRRQQIEAFALPSDSRVALEKREKAALIGDKDDAG